MIYHYKRGTSKGFNALGKAVGFRSASLAGCAVVRIPVDGMVFYAPLSEAKATAETGQTLDYHGDITYESQQNVPCAYFNGGSWITYGYNSDLPSGSAACTMSIWAKLAETSSGEMGSIGYGNSNNENRNQRKLYHYRDGGFSFCNNVDYLGEGGIDDTSAWHHYCATASDAGISLYVDGVLFMTGSQTLNTDSSGTLCIGCDSWRPGSYGRMTGYLAALRIYDRVLSDDEIVELAGEFDV